ncbi:MAG TPA: hypothetical protein VI168_07840 [Croceibacterium sp.]
MTSDAQGRRPTWFQRYLLPGLAFKALVIGGGYATGREVAEFFLPSGPWGGLAAIALATALFSAGCALTFLFALATRSLDYQSFFKALLGRGWVAWEVTYILFVILILAVYGAAAGEIGVALFGLPGVTGTLVLMAGIVLTVMYGNKSVERVFEWVSYLLYGVYALFFVLAFTTFGGQIAEAFATPAPADGWALSGATYFSYNVIGAIVVLPVVRHLTGRRDAIVAGMICGPLTMLPALAFFTAAVAFHPAIVDATLPSDFLLQRLGLPWFHYLFQLMVFSALLESGASAVHAFNERVDKTWQRRRGVPLGPRRRFALALVLLVLCMFLASAVGLVDLIGSGYRLLAFILLAIYVVPLATIGLARILKKPAPGDDDVPQTAP